MSMPVVAQPSFCGKTERKIIMALLDGPFDTSHCRSNVPVPEDRIAWVLPELQYPDHLKDAGPEYTSLDMSGDFV